MSSRVSRRAEERIDCRAPAAPGAARATKLGELRAASCALSRPMARKYSGRDASALRTDQYNFANAGGAIAMSNDDADAPSCR